jgi:tRNA pseudouridine38-40 synthase
MRIAAIVEYLGTNYAGFQIQPNQNTIQLFLQNALSKIANHDIKIEASGRTDAGVHALGQVFHFDTESQRPLSSWQKGANSYLPPDISIKWVSEVDQTFHARFNAMEREYQYLLHHTKTPSAIWYQKAGHYGYEINFKLLDEVLKEFIGKHDFSSFRSSECQSKKPERIIHCASYQKKKILFFLNSPLMDSFITKLEI